MSWWNKVSSDKKIKTDIFLMREDLLEDKSFCFPIILFLPTNFQPKVKHKSLYLKEQWRVLLKIHPEHTLKGNLSHIKTNIPYKDR